MLVDYERAWLELRKHVLSKSGHGSFGPQGLLATMAGLELECAVEEGPTERVLRLFGVQVSEDLIQAVEAASGKRTNGREPSPSSPHDSTGAEHADSREVSRPIPIRRA